jgi:uncharacterized cupin superfamily protein
MEAEAALRRAEAMVLQGRATIRTPEGTFESGPEEVWFFPKGPDGAHQVRNDSDETVRVMMWGQVLYPTVSVYPDSDKVGVWSDRERTDNGLHVKANAVDYFYGETGRGD